MDADCSHEIKIFAPWGKNHDNPREHIKKQRHLFADKGPSYKSYGFSSAHVWMWELDHKEVWVPKNWYFELLNCGAGEDSWESLGQKEIKLVHPKGNQPRIFIGRTDAKAEGQYFDHFMWRADPLEKTLMLGKDWGQAEKGPQRMKCWMASLTQ